MKIRFIRVAVLITVITFGSKLLGFIRDVVMAAVFGATSLMDSYVMAQSIIGVVVLLFGAIGTTFLPVYTEYIEKMDDISRQSFLNTVYTVSFLISILLFSFTVLSARLLVNLFAPNFNEADTALTVQLIIILSPSILMTLFISLDTVLLQVNGRFLIAVAIGIPANVILVSGMLLLTQSWGIYSLAVSSVAGTIAQMGMLWITKRKNRLALRPGIDFQNEGIRQIGVLVFPILLGSGIGQINTFVDRSLASGLPTGSLAAMNFSNRLSNFILGLISASVVSVYFASMSQMSASENDSQFKGLLRNTVNGIIMIMMPVTAAMIVFRLQIVRLIYEHGIFDSSASEMTASALMYFSVGLLAFALRDVFVRAFYARKDTRTTMYNGIISVGVNVILAITLTPIMNLGGLALASSGAGLVGTLLLGYSLYRKIGDFGLLRIGLVFVKVSLASVFVALIAHFIFIVLNSWISSIYLSLTITGLFSTTLYILLVLWLHVDEAHKVKTLILSKIGQLMPIPATQDHGTEI